MITHTIKPPRSGKTHTIAQTIDKESLIVSKTMADFIRTWGKSYGGAYIEAGRNYTGANFSWVKKVFIDELLAFNIHELKWLWDMLSSRGLLDKEIYAYSTPRKTFDKSIYFMARHMTTVVSDPLLSPNMADNMNKGIEEIRGYMLDQKVIVDKTYDKHIKDKPDLDKLERVLGWENFDLMYNLNMLK